MISWGTFWYMAIYFLSIHKFVIVNAENIIEVHAKVEKGNEN